MELSLRERAARTVYCSYCDVCGGERCQTITGRRTTYSHQSRHDVVEGAFYLGYEAGLDDAIDMGERAPRQLRWMRSRNEVDLR